MKAAEIRPVFPAPDILRAAQHRLLEKEAVQRAGVPVAKSSHSFAGGFASSPAGVPWRRRVEYGHRRIRRQWQCVLDPASQPDLAAVYADLAGNGSRELILEERIPFKRKFRLSSVAMPWGDVINFPSPKH